MYFNQSIGATAFLLAMWPVADSLFLCFVFNSHHPVGESATFFQTPSGKAGFFCYRFFWVLSSSLRLLHRFRKAHKPLDASH